MKKTKFGQAMMIYTTKDSGGFRLGFRIHPEEKVSTIDGHFSHSVPYISRIIFITVGFTLWYTRLELTFAVACLRV